MLLIYQIGIRILYLVILLASPFSRRAGHWIKGRRTNQFLITHWKADKKHRTLWMHVSSLGEFEQGRPVLERWKATFPNDRILLSFYSPSGFNIRKNYPLADLVFYLPLDTNKKMNVLMNQLQPDLFILVKYDFWPNLLQILHQRKIPSYLISARFRPDQYLFKKWGRVFLRQLQNFKWIFVQDSSSELLLKEHHCEHVVIAGDTRVDAVMTANRQAATDNRQPVLIGGSTWPAEERMLAKLWKAPDFIEFREKWRLVIAPHDISEEHLLQIEALFVGEIIRHSRIDCPWPDAINNYSVILIDSIGLLSSLYAYADLALIGGGFGKGIHNILEPAAYGIPVVFGPNWTKFREAQSLIDVGAAFEVNDFENFSSLVKKFCSDANFRAESGNLAISYMKSQMGSSDLIIRYLLEKW
ncbi:MAG: 3-deoxy-D-manno-octulosonic acid transferase [Bacteroidia bacterium]|nr:3-deoxy-D-manno-octulosonic acid transferase [Bacteroidia bacterium]